MSIDIEDIRIDIRDLLRRIEHIEERVQRLEKDILRNVTLGPNLYDSNKQVNIEQSLKD